VALSRDRHAPNNDFFNNLPAFADWPVKFDRARKNGFSENPFSSLARLRWRLRSAAGNVERGEWRLHARIALRGLLRRVLGRGADTGGG
jgi:hypothetical protein